MKGGAAAEDGLGSEDEVGHMFHSPFWAVIFPTSTLQKYSIVSAVLCYSRRWCLRGAYTTARRKRI